MDDFTDADVALLETLPFVPVGDCLYLIAANHTPIQSESESDDLVRRRWLPTALYLVSTVSGLATNVLVLAIIVCSKQIRSKPFLFVASICLANLLHVIISAPCHVEFRTFAFGIFRQSVVCKVTMGMDTLAYIVLVLNLTSVALERYFIICIPFQAKRFWTRRTCKVLIAVTWTLAIICGCLMAWIHKSVCIGVVGVQQQTVHFCDTDVISLRTLLGVRLFALFLVPCCIITYCYLMVTWHLWRSTDAEIDLTHTTVRRLLSQHSWTSITAAGSPSLSGGSVMSKTSTASDSGGVMIHIKRQLQNDVKGARQRVIRLLMLVLFAFLLCWTPKLAIEFHREISPKLYPMPDELDLALVVFTFFKFAHATLDPIILFAFSNQFRKECMVVCCCARGHVKRRAFAKQR